MEAGARDHTYFCRQEGEGKTVYLRHSIDTLEQWLPSILGRWRRWCAYIIYKSLGKVEKLSKRDIWRLAKILLHEYEKAIDSTVERLVVKTSVVNSMGNPQDANGEWWARGDLNPGPPPCEGGVLTRLDDGPISSRGIPLGAGLVGINLSRPLPQGLSWLGLLLVFPLFYKLLLVWLPILFLQLFAEVAVVARLDNNVIGRHLYCFLNHLDGLACFPVIFGVSEYSFFCTSHRCYPSCVLYN